VLAAAPTPRAISLERFSAWPAPGSPEQIEFSLRCSKGTYVRVLADELGRALGTVATLAALRRTEFGAFRLAEATSLDELLACPTEALPVLGPRRSLRGFREIEVEPRLAWAIAAGQRAALQALDPPRDDDRFACAIAPNGELLAIVERIERGWELRRVVMPEATELYRSRTPC
jgi:tRNA U55 pseudouridine synthase TruB